MWQLEDQIAKQRNEGFLREVERDSIRKCVGGATGRPSTGSVSGIERGWQRGRRHIGRMVIQVGLLVAGPSVQPKQT